MKYTKPFLSYEEQSALLIRRGLIAPDKAALIEFLQTNNYYRFSIYCRHFYLPPAQGSDHAFQPDTTFAMAKKLYDFDSKLRDIVWEGLEPVEIWMRTALSYYVARKYGPFAHTKREVFKDSFNHEKWIEDILKETKRSKETFVAHFEKQYDEYPHLPIWSTTEVMSFGSLSIMYAGLQPPNQKEIAIQFGLPESSVLRSWLHTLVYIRNSCAHQARLWNRTLAIPPALPERDRNWFPPTYGRRKIATVLFMLNFLTLRLSGGKRRASAWRAKINDLIDHNLEIRNLLAEMGLPVDFKSHPLWS